VSVAGVAEISATGTSGSAEGTFLHRKSGILYEPVEGNGSGPRLAVGA
jgi:hypothetical protein